jgi:hypothetical protein
MRVRGRIYLGEDVADDAALAVLGDVRQLGPRERVVQIVLHVVVLRKAVQVAVLYVEQIPHLGAPDRHHRAASA